MKTKLMEDFRKVEAAINYLVPGTPKWAILGWYVLMFPVGMLLYPFAIVFRKITFWRLGITKEEVKEYTEFLNSPEFKAEVEAWQKMIEESQEA